MKLAIFNGPVEETTKLQLRKINDDEVALEVVDAKGETLSSLLAIRGGKRNSDYSGKGYIVLYNNRPHLEKTGFAVDGNRVKTI